MILTDEQIEAFLTDYPEWVYDDDGMLRCRYEFDSFLEAISFVNDLAQECEEMQHHCDIDIRYQQVTIATVTHDESDQITDKDIALVQRVEHLLV